MEPSDSGVGSGGVSRLGLGTSKPCVETEGCGQTRWMYIYIYICIYIERDCNENNNTCIYMGTCICISEYKYTSHIPGICVPIICYLWARMASTANPE